MSRPATKAVIVGAGIVGLATACRMAESGYDVTVIDSASTPGAGTSRANAGQLLFDRIGAMGSPGFLRSLPRTLLDPSQGVRVLGLTNPGNWRWAGQFLRECTAQAWQANTARLLDLAHLSRDVMVDFRNRHQIDFDWRRPGKLVTYASAEALEAARQTAEFQAQFGGAHRVLSAKDCFAHEPALAATNCPIAGAIHMPDAEVGDCNLCCQELARVLVDYLGTTILYDMAVTGTKRKHNRVVGLVCGSRMIEGDLFIMATGMATPKLLHNRFEGKKPMTSVLGISLTYPIGDTPPDLSVTDASGRFVMVQLGKHLRVCGNAIFSNDLHPNSDDVDRLKSKAQALMPGAANFAAQPVVWIGARPQTPDDLPMIGRAGAENLYVNAGHGSLGWTLAFGSAESLLQTISAVN